MTSHFTSGIEEEFITNLRERIAESSGDVDTIPNTEWVEKFISHPTIPNAPWSFEGHEYQKEILDSVSILKSIKKCSQVGLSELAVIYAFVKAIRTPKTRVIYTLPTTGFANMFCADRINGVINNSPLLQNMLDPALDNLSVKKFSNQSFLYIAGVESEKGAISIPCPTLFKDEIDFSNQKILARLSSRQAHWKEDETLDVSFSTPTIPDYGISERYQKSSKGKYGVKCDSCKEWVTPEFLKDVVIPNYNRSLLDFTSADLLNPRYKVDEAYVACPSCHSKLSDNNMLDPTKRQWIHEISEKVGYHNGYWVQPFDVYSINHPSRILRQIEDYESKQEWVNFRVGDTYLDSNSVLSPPSTTSQPPSSGYTAMGVDVGKTSWIVVGRVANGKVFIIHKEQIINTYLDSMESSVIKRITELKKKYKVKKLVCDGMPDLTLSSMVQLLFKEGYIARYTVSPPAVGKIILFKDTKEVSIFRTEAFNNLASKSATGVLVDVTNDQSRILAHHFKAMSKIYEKGKAKWVNTGQDHYAHACVYMLAATGSYELAKSKHAGLAFTGGVISARIGSETNSKGKKKPSFTLL